MQLFLWDRITLINELGSQDSYAPSVYLISHRARSPSLLVQFFIQRIVSLSNYLTSLQY